jgi:16S rRNA (cytosine967-C5)-methyltransferase
MLDSKLNNKLVNSLVPLIKEALKFNAPLDKLLSTFFRENRSLGAKERSIVAETIYALVRNYYKLRVESLLDQPRTLIGLIWLHILKLNLNELDSISYLDMARVKLIQLDNSIQGQLELPQWIIDKLSQVYSNDELQQLAMALQSNAPLDLRVNILKQDVDGVLKQLKHDGIIAHATPYSMYGIRVKDKTFLAKHKLFTTGVVEVQDEGSQLAGALLSPKRGDMVVDFCAGSGGKTLLLGMLMHNKGRIYAFDVNEKRLNNLTPRLARSGLSNVYPQLINNENDLKVKRLHNKIDRVFIDAPCLGLGTLRRNPELKFRQSPSSLAEITKKQLAILTSASKLVKPGGHLVYATCSILPDENQAIVEQFLESHMEFRLVPVSTVFKDERLNRADGYLTLFPHVHGTDGFFAALIERVK